MTHRGILVGVDGSAASKAAVAWATLEATMHRLPLTLVHVVVPLVPTSAASAEFATMPPIFSGGRKIKPYLFSMKPGRPSRTPLMTRRHRR